MNGRTVTEAVSGFPVHARRRGKQRWCVKGLWGAERAGDPSTCWDLLFTAPPRREESGGHRLPADELGRDKATSPLERSGSEQGPERVAPLRRGLDRVSKVSALLPCGLSYTFTKSPPPLHPPTSYQREVTRLCYRLGAGFPSMAVTQEAPVFLRFAQLQTVCSPSKIS